MNNLIQTDQELAKQLSDFGEQDDVQGMTDLLLGWKNKTFQWLFYVDTRIGMPSSTLQQKEALNKIKEQALAEDVRLLKEYEDFMVNDIIKFIDFTDKTFAHTDNEPELNSFEFSLKENWWNDYSQSIIKLVHPISWNSLGKLFSIHPWRKNLACAHFFSIGFKSGL